MASLRDIKNRINNINAIAKITQSMKVISTSRLYFAKSIRNGNSKYFASVNKSLQTLFDFHKNLKQSREDKIINAIFSKEQSLEGKTLIIFIQSDRGLCGGYNGNITKSFVNSINDLGRENCVLLPIGNKSIAFSHKHYADITLPINTLSELKNIKEEQILLIANYIMKLFNSSAISKVEVHYTYSKSLLEQIVEVKSLLPILDEEMLSHVNDKQTKEIDNSIPEDVLRTVVDEYNFDTTLNTLLVDYFVSCLYDCLTLSSIAEHASRLQAMDNAYNNSKDLHKDLQLLYNRKRQSKITEELVEIISGANVV